MKEGVAGKGLRKDTGEEADKGGEGETGRGLRRKIGE